MTEKTLSRKQIFENMNQNDTYEFNITESKENIPNISELKNALQDMTDGESQEDDKEAPNILKQKESVLIEDSEDSNSEEDYKIDI